MSDEKLQPDAYGADGIPGRVRENRERLSEIDREELLDTAANLVEIQRHREWRIDALTDHIANIENDLAKSSARVLALEEHIAHVERERDEATRHADNLEQRLAEREVRLADVETHLLNLERRMPPRPTRLAQGRMFPTSPYPRTEALFRAGNRLLEARDDLRQRFSENAAADFWYWLLWNGPRADEQVAPLMPPVPDTHLIGRVVGEQTNGETYLRSGVVDWWSLDGSLRRAGFDPVKGGRVLDFGCGCGRILSVFSLYADRCELHGVDVDAEAIAWCQAKLDFAEFAAIGAEAPTSFSDATFDAIYAFSVFSHLPEERHLDWLAELARITRPGGAVVLTIQGKSIANKIVSGDQPGQFPKAKVLKKQLHELDERGFLFFPYKRLSFHDARNDKHFAEWDLEEYGATFILESYVREHWTRWFEVVEVIPSPDDWQDHVILRRR